MHGPGALCFEQVAAALSSLGNLIPVEHFVGLGVLCEKSASARSSAWEVVSV